jgi:hypothetical protein
MQLFPPHQTTWTLRNELDAFGRHFQVIWVGINTKEVRNRTRRLIEGRHTENFSNLSRRRGQQLSIAAWN